MTIVCIAGMHRSGTSMIARMLNLCGLDLGETQDLLPAQPDNPEGFWENHKFVAINEAILTSLGGSWDMPPDPDSISNRQQDLAFLEEQARNLIDEFVGKIFWGWKDPRNSLTFPFWQRLIPDLKIVICLRNPIEVSQSLVRRNQFSEIFSLNLWQTYNQRLMTSVAPTHRLITHYNTYFAEPEAELHRLLEFMNIEVDNEAIREACQATLLSLRHNRATFGNLIEAGAPLDAVNLYLEMCKQAGQPYLNAIKQIAQLPSGNNERFNPEVEQKLLSKFIEKDPLVHSMAFWLAEKQRQISLISEQISLKNEQISKEKKVKEQAVQLVQSLTVQLAEKEQSIQLLRLQIGEQTNALTEIQKSRAWRLAQFYKKIKSFKIFVKK